jgi:RHS repeat-associated protein
LYQRRYVYASIVKKRATGRHPELVSYGYDLTGRLTSVSDTSAAIVAAVPPGPNTQYATSTTYDALNRPTAVTWTPAPTAASPTASTVTFTHAYSKTNQRTGQATTDNSWWFYPAAVPSTVSYTTNANNAYTRVGGTNANYDPNGNLINDGTFGYGYDAENRMTSAFTGFPISYAYDGQGRRKLKNVNGTITVFVTDADNREVLEYDGTSGAILRWYAYGLGSNNVLNQVDVAAGTRTTLIPDIQGSIIGTLDSSSGALTKRGYLPYGASASAAGTFAYTGQRIDPETNGLYYYRARMYRPTWGRFMQVDPIGYAGGSNLYAYVGNDPLNLLDPLGLSPDSPQAAGAGGAAWGNVGTALSDLLGISSASAAEYRDPTGISSGRQRELRDLIGGGGGPSPSGAATLTSPPAAPASTQPSGPGAIPPSGSVGGTGSAPNFIVSPGGTIFPVPGGATRSEAATGRGFQFKDQEVRPHTDSIQQHQVLELWTLLPVVYSSIRVDMAFT